MRIRYKAFLAVLIFSLVTGTTALLYVRSDSFQTFAREMLLSRLEQTTGLVATVEKTRLDLLSGRFRIDGLKLRSALDNSQVFRLAIDETTGSVRLLSLWPFRVRIAELAATRPHLILVTGGEDSSWNPELLLGALRRSLEFAAGRVLLKDGWIELNNRRIPLNATLDDVACEIRYEPKPEAYSIRLAYKHGQLVWSDRTLSYDLEARSRLSLEGLDVERIEVKHGQSILAGEGSMRNWSAPNFLFHMDGSLVATDLSLLHATLADAQGEIRVQSNLGWDERGFHSTGKFSSEIASYREAVLNSVQGTFEIVGDVLSLRGVDGRMGPGSFQIEGSFVLGKSPQSPHQLSISATNLQLRDASRILGTPAIDFENTVDSQLRLSWRQGIQDVELTGSVRLNGPIETTTGGGRITDLRGNAEFRYAKGIWYVPKGSFDSPHTTISVQSRDDAVLHVKLKTDVSSEPLSLVRSFSPPVDQLIIKYPDIMEIVGKYELDGDFRIESSSEASYQGVAKALDARWRGYSADSLAASAHWQGRNLQLRSLQAQKGSQRIEGELRLAFAEQDPSPRVGFRGSIRQVSLGSLKDFGISLPADLEGILSGTGSVSNEKGVWNGEGAFTVEKGKFRGEGFDLARGQVQANDRILSVVDGQLNRDRARINLRGQVRLDTREMNLAVRLSGLGLNDVPALRERKLDLDGQLAASGQLRGMMDNPAFAASVELDGLRYASWNLGRGSGSIEMENGILKGSVQVESDLGSFQIVSEVSTEAGFPGKVEIGLKEWDTRKMMEGKIPSLLTELSTALQGRIEVNGKFAEPSTLALRGEMDGARFKIHDYELHNSSKIRFTGINRKIRIDEARVVGDGTDLALNGVIPLDGSADLDLRVNGNLNLRFLEHLETKVRVSGSAGLSVRAAGSLEDPQVIGQATLNDARFDYGDLPFHPTSIQGNVIFSRNAIRFENVNGKMASGTVRLTGSLEHENAQLQGVNLQGSFHGARLTYPKDFQSTVDSELVLRGKPDSLVLSGDLNVIRSDYLKDFNLLEQLASRTPTMAGSFVTDSNLLGLRLNVNIHSDGNMFIDNELTRLQASMRLALTGTAAYPSLTGRVEANEGAIFFRGNRFDITHGAADFLDRNRINPLLDVRAEANVKTYRLLLDVSGDLDHLRFNVTSDPPLSTVEIVSLLTTGKSSFSGTDSSRHQAEITGLSAASILSESLTGVVGKRVQRLFGLQSFRLDPFLAGAERNPTARVTISERVSNDLAITFSRNLSTNEEQIVVVEYDVSKNVSIVATRDEDGQFGVDFRFRRRFR